MGREIRRVPPDWDHPLCTTANAPHPSHVGKFMLLYDNDYETAAEEWLRELDLWKKGEHPRQSKSCKYFWEYSSPPDESFHRKRKWTVGEATHYQIYETVSEGTPVSPVFASLEDMIEWMIRPVDRASVYNCGLQEWQTMQGMTREQAERFCKDGGAFSLVNSPEAGPVVGHRA